MLQNQPHFYRGRFSVAPMLGGQHAIVVIFHRQFQSTRYFTLKWSLHLRLSTQKYDHLDF